MTQDETIEMAKQAGLYTKTCVIASAVPLDQMLVAFAELVAAKERESIIQIIKAMPFSNWFQFDVIEAIRERGEQA
jgi:hypothetical protein